MCVRARMYLFVILIQQRCNISTIVVVTEIERAGRVEQLHPLARRTVCI